jgi:hypothetical protein
MPLIVKGQTNIISKKEMEEKLAIENDKKDPLEGLSESQKEIRKEIQAAKRHREFMERVAKNEVETIATSEIVTVANQEIVKFSLSDMPRVALPEFETMTKAQIGTWAEENLGLVLDLRKLKASLIEELKNHL